jgi:hypothetical protein
MKRLLIDDLRDETHVGHPLDFIARDYSAGIEALKSQHWDILYLDHDLASFIDGIERTGYHIMCFLEEFPEFLPGKIVCVSDNSVGRKRIELVVKALYEKRNND